MELEYQLIRSRKRKKTLSLKITGTGAIVIQAPYHTPAGEIAAFFERKKTWVQEKLRQYKESPALSPQPLQGGESFLFLGVPYPLVVEGQGRHLELFTLKNEQFVLNGQVRGHGKDLIRAWFSAQAKDYLPRRVEAYSQTWGLYAKGIRIGNAASRWGSCSPENILSFTWRLVMAPPDVVDYVVVHELAHVREKNHARSFWALVGTMMPDYELHRRWLRKHGYRLHL